MSLFLESKYFHIERRQPHLCPGWSVWKRPGAAGGSVTKEVGIAALDSHPWRGRLIKKGACEGLIKGSGVPATPLPGGSSGEELGGRHEGEPFTASLLQSGLISHLDGLGNQDEARDPCYHHLQTQSPLSPSSPFPGSHPPSVQFSTSITSSSLSGAGDFYPGASRMGGFRVQNALKSCVVIKMSIFFLRGWALAFIGFSEGFTAPKWLCEPPQRECEGTKVGETALTQRGAEAIKTQEGKS